jgi:NAD(P)H-hydrate epimerase
LGPESGSSRALSPAVEQTKATVLLKGSRTLIGSPGHRIAVNPTGSPVLATGGTGDVLSGVIAALAVGTDPMRAACAGAYVHGLAAEIVARDRGVERGILAHEVADAVPVAIASLLGIA